MPLKSLKINGGSTQATRSGKNKLDLKDINKTDSCTVAVESNNLKVVTTSTTLNPIIIINCSLEPGNYFLHLDKVTNDLNVAFYNNNRTKIGSNINESNKFTLSEKATYMYINSSVSEGNYNLPFESLYINEGNEDLGFEQYGASPSPGFPSERHSVADDVNLFDKNAITDNSWLLADGTIESVNNNYCVSDFIEVKEGEIHFIPKRETTRTKFYLSDKTSYSNTWDVSDYAQAITIPAGVKYIRFTINKTSVDINKFKFSKGTVATPYSEFGKGTVEIKQHRENLWDTNKQSLSSSLTYDSTTDTYTANDKDTRNYLAYKFQQYNASSYITQAASSVITSLGRIYLTQTIAEKCTMLRFANMGATKEFNLYLPLPEDIKPGDAVTLVVDIIDTTIGTSKFKNIMLLKGTYTAENVPDYEPHFLESYILQTKPLRSLKNGAKDELRTSKVGSKIFDGSDDEGWEEFNDIRNNTIRVQITIKDMKNIGNSVGLNIMSSHFEAKNIYGYDIEGIEHIYNQIFIRINKSELAEVSLSGFKAWLQQNPIEVQYELAEEVVEQLDEQLQKVINSIRTHKGTTYISSNGAEMEIEYYKDLQTLFDKVVGE